MREPHGFLGAAHGAGDRLRVRHLHRDRVRVAPAVEHLERADRQQREAVERLTEHSPLGRDDADDREPLAEDAHVAPDGGGIAVEELLGHVGADDGDHASLPDVDVGEGASGGEAVVLDGLVRRGDAEDQDVTEGEVAPDDVGLRRRPTGGQAHGARVGDRASHDLGVVHRDARPSGVLADLLVVEESHLDRRAANLERVGADDRARDVLADVRVHPLNDGDDGDEERHRDDDAEQGEERPELVAPDLGEGDAEDVVGAHASL